MWRNITRINELSSVRGHVVQSQIVYPAAGYVSMAIEACVELSKKGQGLEEVSGSSLRDISIGKALMIPGTPDGVEVVFSLRPDAISARTSSVRWNEFRISSYLKIKGG